MLKRLLSAFFSLFFLGAASGTSFAEVTVPDVLKAVSYTHLTLPTT